jgi:hypothetical protein
VPGYSLAWLLPYAFSRDSPLRANWEELSANRKVAFYPGETWEANSLATTIEPQLHRSDNGFAPIVPVALRA